MVNPFQLIYFRVKKGVPDNILQDKMPKKSQKGKGGGRRRVRIQKGGAADETGRMIKIRGPSLAVM